MSEYIEARAADGYTYMDKLIVPVCPVCGGVHMHTNRGGYSVGDRTTRVPHCHAGEGMDKLVMITVRGELSEKKAGWLMKKMRYGIRNKRISRTAVLIPVGSVGRV